MPQEQPYEPVLAHSSSWPELHTGPGVGAPVTVVVVVDVTDVVVTAVMPVVTVGVVVVVVVRCVSRQEQTEATNVLLSDVRLERALACAEFTVVFVVVAAGAVVTARLVTAGAVVPLCRPCQ